MYITFTFTLTDAPSHDAASGVHKFQPLLCIREIMDYKVGVFLAALFFRVDVTSRNIFSQGEYRRRVSMLTLCMYP